ncbi:hypothetical protein MED01_002415 [Micromonospora sp. MED01]|uniref:hypothetical protein n=1 Tax=Micromonospora alfalfae TaxID=2911212 RepID=UPI001EE792AC|nr:hypothetical protein [Micromonospora alfalfae]MCG5464250.1 hypothetical protein [Micromonospora alfalfae]
MLPTFGVAAGWTPSLTGRHPTHLGGDVDVWRLHNGRAVRGSSPAPKGSGVNTRLDADHLFACGVSGNRIRANRGSRYPRRRP